MNKENLKESIESNYDIKVLAIEKVKNSYRLETENTNYAMKIIKYDFPHFYFILSAIEHLQKREFHKIPQILNNKDGTKYIKLENSYAYLTEWIPSRVSNYDNPIELSKVAEKLGELHTRSTGFNINNNMRPRIGWYAWINVFNTRCNEILDKEVMKMGFCHHDYAHHNILVDDKNELNIIDFDYCILDSHLHDLASLLIRAMKGAKWSKDKADLIIKNYCKSNGLYEDEFKLIGDFIKFPQTFWQIGIQYYWEQQPWGEDFFEEKINKYLEDVEYREEFLESYFK